MTITLNLNNAVEQIKPINQAVEANDAGQVNAEVTGISNVDADPAGVSSLESFADKPVNAQLSLYRTGVLEQAQLHQLSAIGLTTSQIEQIYTNREADALSPEAVSLSSIGAEPIRSTVRLGRTQLLSTPLPWDFAYQKLTLNQPEDLQLPKESYQALRQFFSQFSFEQRQVIEATAVLKPSKEKNEKYALNGHKLPADSEQNLTEVAKLATQDINHMPAIEPLSLTQRQSLAACYSPSCHFRHFLFAESGVKELNDAVQTLTTLSDSDFQMWQARWWVDLCGFDRNLYGITKNTFQRAELLFKLIDSARSGNSQAAEIMPEYLALIGNLSSLPRAEKYDQLSSVEKQIAGQLLAYYEEPNLAIANAIVEGMLAQTFADKAALVAGFQSFHQNLQAQPPTYLPAVIKTATSEFKKLGQDEVTALENATLYACELLTSVYQAVEQNPSQIVSSRNAAYFVNWQKNSWARAYMDGRIRFTVNAQGEVETNIDTHAAVISENNTSTNVRSNKVRTDANKRTNDAPHYLLRREKCSIQ